MVLGVASGAQIVSEPGLLLLLPKDEGAVEVGDSESVRGFWLDADADAGASMAVGIGGVGSVSALTSLARIAELVGVVFRGVLVVGIAAIPGG